MEIRALFAWGFLAVTGGAPPFFLRGPSVAPAPPAVPLPRCRWEQLPIRGRRGPSLPAGPSLPHLRKTRFCTPCFASCEGATPYKTSCFAQVRGPALGWVGRSLSLPVDSRGGYPPAPPPRPEQGRARCVPVGRRAASPRFGFATSPALRRLRRSAPGAAPPLAGSATAPPLSGALAPLYPPSRQRVRHRVDSRDCGVAV